MKNNKSKYGELRQFMMNTAGAVAMPICLALVMTGEAHAQAADEQAQVANDDIVVTAQFRAQNLQQTPLAITAVTSDMLEARSQTSLTDVAQRAPSVTLTTANAGLGGAQTAAISIRGIGQTDPNLAFEPGVGLYVDDVYYGTMYGSTLDLLDLDRVEILRGPQGTLAGKNAEGGALKLYSKKPDETTEGYIEGTVGSYDRIRLRGGLNFTLVPEKLFVRITGMGERQDGFVKRYDYQCVNGPNTDLPASTVTGGNSCLIGRAGGKNVVALRGAVRYVASDRVENLLTVDYSRDRSEPAPAVLIEQGAFLGPWLAPGTRNPLPDFTFPQGSYKSYSTYTALVGTPYEYSFPDVSSVDSWGVSNVLDVGLNDSLSLKSITAYRKLDQASVGALGEAPLSPVVNFFNIGYRQFTQELRLNGTVGENIDFTLGGFYFKSDADQDGRVNIDGGISNWLFPTDIVTTDKVKVRSKSVFGHLEFRPVDRVSLTAGLRYTNDKKSFAYGRSRAPGYDQTPVQPVEGAFLSVNGANLATKPVNRVDYRFTASFEADRNLTIYAQTATGFKGGGSNPRPFSPLELQSFEPETVKSYELGVKSMLFDRRLRLNMAAFINKFNDIQLVVLDCTFIGAGPCALPLNVGDATIKGFEVEGVLNASDALLVDFSASHTDFQYDRIGNPAAGVTTSMASPYTPRWKASIGAQYRIDLGSAGSVTPRLDYQYNSGQFSQTVNATTNRLPALNLVNARLSWWNKDEDLQISLEATNLFDKYYFVAKNDAVPYNMINGVVGAPRRWAITVKRNF